MDEQDAGSPTTRSARLTPATWSAIYLGVSAATLLAVLPVMIGVFADRLGFGTAGAGTIASANVIAILIGSVICPLVTRSLAWPAAIRLGLGVMVLGNLLTILGAGFAYIAATRFLSGVGEGLVGGICYVTMGQASRPARAVSFYLAGQSLVGVAGLGSFNWIASTFGWQWLFVLLSGLILPGFWLANSIGAAQPSKAAQVIRLAGIEVPAWYALGGILLFFTGMASVWSFLERIGHVKGLSTGMIAFALSVSAFAGFLGSLSVGVAAHRLPARIGLAIALAALVAGVLGIAILDGAAAYVVATCLFYFAWSFQYAFQFALFAGADRHGHLLALTPVATGGGLAIGPAIGGFLLQYAGLATVCGFGLVCVVISVVGALRLQRYACSQQSLFGAPTIP